jgi:hypothetical protein
LSYHTVDNHLRSIYTKLQVHTRGGAVESRLRGLCLCRPPLRSQAAEGGCGFGTEEAICRKPPATWLSRPGNRWRPGAAGGAGSLCGGGGVLLMDMMGRLRAQAMAPAARSVRFSAGCRRGAGPGRGIRRQTGIRVAVVKHPY